MWYNNYTVDIVLLLFLRGSDQEVITISIKNIEKLKTRGMNINKNTFFGKYCENYSDFKCSDNIGDCICYNFISKTARNGFGI